VSKLANFVGFQACWFACVLGAAHGREWLGPVVVLVFVALALRGSPKRARELLALAGVALIGTVVDSLEVACGWLRFEGTLLAGVLAPAWIVALWVAFALTFDSSLAWLAGRRVWFGIFGLFGAPLSYWGGVRMGALEFGEPLLPALGGIGVAWGVALPLASWAFERLRGSGGGETGARSP
jgi:hypothetical protein